VVTQCARAQVLTPASGPSTDTHYFMLGSWLADDALRMMTFALPSAETALKRWHSQRGGAGGIRLSGSYCRR